MSIKKPFRSRLEFLKIFLQKYLDKSSLVLYNTNISNDYRYQKEGRQPWHH